MSFSLFLFSVDTDFVRLASQSGLAGIIVDWESKNKVERQTGFDTQINTHTLDDLRRVRAATNRTVLCRVNGATSGRADQCRRELEAAIEAGADEIFLPMVREPWEVEAVLRMINDRARLGILIETGDAVSNAAELAQFPLSHVYVGLNDLWIDTKRPNIFSAIADGTVEELRAHFPHIPFGFGGLTLPHCGHPVPCRLLMAEMARLRCDFTFLRRSFHRDVQGGDPAEAITQILHALDQATGRSAEEIKADRVEIFRAITFGLYQPGSTGKAAVDAMPGTPRTAAQMPPPSCDC